MLSDFKSFLLKQNIVALAIAVVVGGSLGGVVKGIVDDFIMPIVLAATPGGDWQKWTLTLGPVNFGVGHFLAQVINFLIIGIVAWRIARIFIKAEIDSPTKKCAFCVMSIDELATRCPHCTSELARAPSP
jgi:large conductance mechanosensitive channel